MSDYGAWGGGSGATSASKSTDPLQPVRNQMEALTKEIGEYSFQISSIGGYQDNTALRSKVKATKKQCMNSCQRIKTDLQTLSDSADRVQFDRISSQFLEQVKRVEGLSKEASNQVSLHPLNSAQSKSDERTPLNAQQMQQQQQQQQNQQIDMDLAEQRKNDLLSVERDMTGLRDAFVDLNNLVQEQGEDIIKIEDATSSAVGHTGDASGELSQALINQRKARKKCIILITILFVILCLIILIIILSIQPWKKNN